jgi:tetratricopeptide (TPR) repeat protein
LKPERGYFLFILICIAQLILPAQNKPVSALTKADSLKLELKNAKHDSIKLRVYANLSEVCETEDILKYAEPAVSIAEKSLKNCPGDLRKTYLGHLSTALHNIGFNYGHQGKYAKAIEFLKRSIELKEEIGDKNGIAASLNNIGFFYHSQGNIKSAIEYYQKGLSIRENINDKRGISYSLNNIGSVYQDQGDILRALEYFQRSLRLFEELHEPLEVSTLLNNIGMIFEDQGEIQKGLEYYLKSLKMTQELNDKQGTARAFNNIGNVYYQEGIASKNGSAKAEYFGKAFEFYNKSLKIKEKINDKFELARTLNNIGLLYKSQGDFLKATEFYNKSLEIQEEINDRQGIAYSLNNIAAVLLNHGQTENALKYSLRSLTLSSEMGSPENIKNASGLLYQIYKMQNKYALALSMHELFIQMRDSINNTEILKSITKQQFKYEYEKKELTFKMEQEKKDVIHADQSKHQKIIVIFVVIGSLIVLVFSIFLFKRFKITQKQKKIIESQKLRVDEAYQQLHEKNKEVIDSITYALRIQRALLPHEKYIDKHLNKLNRK